jgi:pSer/pThr/pTyr-binding forkhead associated (FHA) protein
LPSARRRSATRILIDAGYCKKDGNMADFYGKLILGSKDERYQEFVLSKGNISLGRSTVSDIVLDDESISRNHARLVLEPSGFIVHDLGSSNGTFVNGTKVKSKALDPGDVIQLGKVTLHFETGALPIDTDVTSLASADALETAIKWETIPVMIEDHGPSLTVVTSGRTWNVPLDKEAVTIGRQPGNDIVLATPMASRAHARLERRQEQFVLRDLNSRNGTLVNGVKIAEQPLQGGETIRIGSARLIFKRGFSADEIEEIDLTSPGRATDPRPVVFVPGLLGSELWLDNERIFPNIKVFLSRPEVLRMDTPGVRVGEVVSEVVIIPNVIKQDQYNRLGNYLGESLGYERGKNLLEFGYDFRQDNRISARQLAEAIEQWRARSSHARRPITIIAHSNGCLVSRYYVECLGGNKHVERLIFMGAPHYGSPKIISSLLIGPDVLPFGLMGERLRKMLATHPSAYQLLPTYTCVVDQEGQNINVYMDEDWISEEQRKLLRDARRFRKELGTRSSVPSISIFGYGFNTITRVAVKRDAQKKWIKVNCQEAPGGDATVPESSAILKGSEIHPVRQYHGSLYTDNDVKMRLRMELTQDTGYRP